MRNFLKSSGRRLNAGWLWPLVLLALPGCLLDASAYPGAGDPVLAFDPGPLPRTSAIMCEIPKPGTTQCATQDEADGGMPTTRAAVALAEGDNRTLALDYSPNNCPGGLPMRTEFFGPYPDGLTVCLNCTTQIPDIYPDANKACIAKCKDLLNANEGEPEGGVDAYCENNAKVAPNFNKTLCFPGACDNGGTPLSPPAFIDPRRFPEPVIWIVDPADGTQATDNSLTRVKPTTDTNSDAGFDAGSEAVQVIMKGDAWVEFEVGNDPTETQLSHVLGLSQCGFPCDINSPPADFDPSLNDIEFSISLNKDGNVYVIENPGLVVHGPFGAQYGVDERFRVNVVDKHNGTAEISYSRLTGTCTVGTDCAEDVFFTSSTTATYPLRIDTSFREENATLQSVTIVRIQ